MASHGTHRRGPFFLLAAALIAVLLWLGAHNSRPREDALERVEPPALLAEEGSTDLATGGHGRLPVDRPQAALVRPENAGGGTRVVVSNVEGEPIEGARLVLQSAWELLGSTGPEGALDLRTGLEPSDLLLALASGYVSESVCVSERESGLLEIQMRTAWTLSGRVVDPSGASVGPGVRVIALQPIAHMGSGRLGASIDGLGPIPTVLTNATGEFSFANLSERLPYRFYAGGGGFCVADSFGELYWPAATQAPVVLTVYPVYGLHVKLREADGAALQLNEHAAGRWWGGGLTPLVEDGRIVFSGEWTQLLLGVEGPSTESASQFDRTDYFTTQVDYGDAIEVSFDPDYPGYDAARFRLRADRVRSGVAEHTLTLNPNSAGFGSLTTWLEPVDHLASIVSSENAPGRGMHLLLSDPAGVEQSIKLPLSGMAGGQCELTGIPFGTYSAQFRAPHQLFRFPKHEQGSRLVTVGAALQNFRVPVEDLGSLRFDIVKADGSPFVGGISGTHTRDLGGESDAFAFSAPPYGIPLLPSGDYTLSVWVDAIQTGAAFSIRENEITELELQVVD